MAGAMIADELVFEIMSWLPVKPLLRFTCVNKWFKSLVSDPTFVKLHLQRSPKGSNFLIRYLCPDNTIVMRPCSISCLSQNHAFHNSHDHVLLDNPQRYMSLYYFISSCNGLVCLVSEVDTVDSDDSDDLDEFTYNFFFSLWNPATGKKFQVSECLIPANLARDDLYISLGFGYDDRSDTYKVVAVIFIYDLDLGPLKSCEVKIRSTGDNNGWRNIGNFPSSSQLVVGYGIHLNSTLNWIASSNVYDRLEAPYTFNALLIVSLDLRNETFSKLLLPQVLEGVRADTKYPSIMVLGDCLSLFFQYSETEHLVIWQMKEFGNRNSWTPLVNIGVEDIEPKISPPRLLPLCIFKNGLFLVTYYTTFESEMLLIFYDLRDRSVVDRTTSTNTLSIWDRDYVPSLISPNIAV